MSRSMSIVGSGGSAGKGDDIDENESERWVVRDADSAADDPPP